MESRHALLPSTRHLLPLAVAAGGVMALLAPVLLVRLGFLAGAVALALLWGVLRLRRPVLVVGPEGYRVEVRGVPGFTVRWSEVRLVRRDRAERALHVDCGDPGRALLVPPRGYAFTFAKSDELFARICAAVEGRPAIQVIEGLAPPQKTLSNGR